MRLFVQIVLTAIGALVVGVPMVILAARQAAPILVHEDESREVIVAAAADLLSEYRKGEKSEIFVAINGHDPDSKTLSILQGVSHRVKPFSLRPSTAGCGNREPQVLPISGCQLNLLDLRLLSMPFWRTAFVAAQTPACGHDLILVKAAASWHVISHRGWCA
jgi:hypothetical protein